MLLAAALVAAGTSEPPPSPIRFNQTGLESAAGQRIALKARAGAPLDWHLRDAGGRLVAQGTAPAPRRAPDAGETMTLVTLPDALPPGRYVLETAGQRSRTITVAARPFAPLFRDAMSFFYQQRAGTPILERFVQRADLARPAGHAPEVVTCFAGTDQHGVRWPGCRERRDVTGGWYDAGDRGKYVVNAGITVWTLLDAWERAPGSALFGDGSLRLPEAGNGVPDLLDEARWEIEWMLRMQLPERATATVASSDGRGTRVIDAGGLSYHKVADVAWAPLPIRVEDDHGPRALYPPSTAATLNLAAVTAQAARIWRPIDAAFAARCREAATRAFAAARRHPALLADTRFTGSGGYQDDKLDDEFFWAAVELAITTGDGSLRDFVAASPSARTTRAPSLGWPTTATAGIISLLRHPARFPSALVATQRRALLATADGFLADEARQPYGYPAASGETQWGSNGALLDRAIILGTAFDLTGDRRYRDAVRDAADYVLGRNPLDRSYVSGYGVRPMRFPHHRFWAAGADPNFPVPPPGVLSGGPNSAAMTDDVARKMHGRCTPETCWADDARAYTQNEVAINWNAPLAWVAAFLDGTRR